MENLQVEERGQRFRPVATFLGLTYLASWLVEVPAALTKLGLLHVPVSHGLQTAAQFAPALAALITAAALFGSASVQQLLSPLIKVRAPLRWYGLVLLVAPVSQFVALLLYRASGHPMPLLSPWPQLPVAMLVLALFSIGEELGWRGFYLPQMAKRHSPRAVAAWMALFWGVWHLPFYLAAGSEGQNTWLLYLLFLSGILPVCAFFVLIFSKTRSLLLCMLFHGSLNGGAAYFFGPLPTGQLLPFALWIVLLWLMSVPVFMKLGEPSSFSSQAA